MFLNCSQENAFFELKTKFFYKKPVEKLTTPLTKNLLCKKM